MNSAALANISFLDAVAKYYQEPNQSIKALINHIKLACQARADPVKATRVELTVHS